MDSKDSKWFHALGFIALLAWPIYWLYKKASKD